MFDQRGRAVVDIVPGSSRRNSSVLRFAASHGVQAPLTGGRFGLHRCGRCCGSQGKAGVAPSCATGVAAGSGLAGARADGILGSHFSNRSAARSAPRRPSSVSGSHRADHSANWRRHSARYRGPHLPLRTKIHAPWRALAVIRPRARNICGRSRGPVDLAPPPMSRSSLQPISIFPA